MIDCAVRTLMRSYGLLPVKPFKGVLIRCYRIYRKARKNRTVNATIDGIHYHLDLNEFIDSAIYYEGSFERCSIATCRGVIRPGMIVMDIGANIGYYTLNLAKLVGGSGQVFAFEPTAWAFKKLVHNISLNDFSNITVEKLALSDQVETQRAEAFPTAFRASFTLDKSSANIDKSEEISFTTLDDYVKKLSLPNLDFIKIDVDGYEYRVVRGALETLRTYRPLILIEIGKSNLEEIGDRPTDLVRLLSDLGYRFYNEDGSYRFPSGELMLEAIPSHKTANIFCKPEQRLTEKAVPG